ncbi:UNVERIFIED_CONTAM: hypothetical protein K2H54_054363 [Gekko kuhli]
MQSELLPPHFPPTEESSTCSVGNLASLFSNRNGESRNDKPAARTDFQDTILSHAYQLFQSLPMRQRQKPFIQKSLSNQVHEKTKIMFPVFVVASKQTYFENS